MPGMNGSELATQLVLHHPEMKVLFTSGYTEDVISHHGVLAEGVSFIGKPYTPSALARKVREVIDEA
jgi:two-component SAPR family response regulator